MKYIWLIAVAIWIVVTTMAACRGNYPASFNAGACAFYCFLLHLRQLESEDNPNV